MVYLDVRKRGTQARVLEQEIVLLSHTSAADAILDFCLSISDHVTKWLKPSIRLNILQLSLEPKLMIKFWSVNQDVYTVVLWLIHFLLGITTCNCFISDIDKCITSHYACTLYLKQLFVCVIFLKWRGNECNPKIIR